LPDSGKKIPKTKLQKNLKTSFRHYFYPNRDEIGQDREKKNCSPEFRSYATMARKFPEKMAKNFKKLKNVNPALFLSKPG